MGIKIRRSGELKMKIQEKMYVPINGQEQYIHIRGESLENPVILYLHGGPAGPDSYILYEFARELCEEYTLVSWEQRGCGRTYFKNKRLDSTNQTATFEQALQDVDAVVTYLCQRFQKEKIILLGHSYGTLLGVNYVSIHTEKIEKYIGIGQVVSIYETEEKNCQEIIETLGTEDKKAASLSAAYREFRDNFSMNAFIKYKKMVMPQLIANRKDMIMANQVKLALKSPDFAVIDIRWILGTINPKKHYARNQKLFDYTFKADLRENSKDFELPMFFLSGEYDVACNVKLVEQYFEMISAPIKKLKVMEKCGHNLHMDKPLEAVMEIKQFLK